MNDNILKVYDTLSVVIVVCYALFLDGDGNSCFKMVNRSIILNTTLSTLLYKKSVY